MINGAALFYGLVIFGASYLFVALVALVHVVLDDIIRSRKRRKRK